MESPALKRTLSTIKPEFNFHFTCWFDRTVKVVEEVQEAKQHCNTNEVLCDHRPDQEWAIVMGTGAYHKTDVECVRYYLLDYLGWREGEEE